jgi:hypothetical protein
MARPGVKNDDNFSASESAQRTEAALRAAFNSPHKTYEESKIGKRKSAAKKSPGRRKPVKKSG